MAISPDADRAPGADPRQSIDHLLLSLESMCTVASRVQDVWWLCELLLLTIDLRASSLMNLLYGSPTLI